ncbi:MAG: glycoside hydrolase family 15 protein, partial [Bdellovibrionota bacterium]
MFFWVFLLSAAISAGATQGRAGGECAQAFTSNSPQAPTALELWLGNQDPFSTQAVLTSIDPKGSVLASPSTSPDYRYHWVRDGALTMDSVMDLYERSQDPGARARYLSILDSYAKFSRRNQLTPNPSGAPDGMGLGEPKFNLDGSAFTDANGYWGPGAGLPIDHLLLPFDCERGSNRTRAWPLAQPEGGPTPEFETVWVETARQLRAHFDADPHWRRVGKVVFLDGLDESY